MMKMIVCIVTVVFSCLLVQVSCDCFFMEGSCQDGDFSYNDGDMWMSKERPCYSCMCYEDKEEVRLCLEVDNKDNRTEEDEFLGVKKSSVMYQVFSFQEIERVISEEEAENFQCPPEPSPYFDFNSMTVVYPPFIVARYVKIVGRGSHCCKTGMEPSNVHPLCKVKQINQCDTEVVMRNDESQPCMFPHNARL